MKYNNYLLKVLVLVVVCFASNRLLGQKVDTTSSNKYLKSGWEKFNADKNVEAITDIDKAIIYNPKNWKAYRAKADVELESNDYKNALKNYEKALLINPSDAKSHSGKADALRDLDRKEESITEYTISISLDSNYAENYLGRGQSYYAIKNYLKAETDFTKTIELMPELSVIYMKRALALYRQKKYTETIEDCNTYIKLKGKFADPYYFKGASQVFLCDDIKDKKEKAAVADSAIANIIHYTNLKGFDHATCRTLGMAYALKGDSVPSEKYFRMGLTMNPPDLCYYYSKWGISEIRLGRYKQAVIMYNESEKTSEGELNEYFYYYRGAAEEGMEDTVKALQDYQKALEVNSSNTEIREHRFKFVAKKALTDSNYQKIAMGDINWYMQTYKEDTVTVAEMYAAKAFIHCNSKDTTIVRNNINKAIALLPKEPAFYVIRACLYGIAGASKEQIINDLDKAVAVDSTMWEAYLYKAGILVLKSRDFKNACENIKLCLKYGGEVPVDVENYICKRKKPKGQSYLEFYVFPKVRTKSKTTIDLDFK